MVAVLARELAEMEGQQGVAGDGAEEFGDQLGVESADGAAAHLQGAGEEGAAAQVERAEDERLVHGDGGAAVAADPALVANRLRARLPQADADVLDRVVLV